MAPVPPPMAASLPLPRPLPGLGYLAYLTDSDGNHFGVMETDEAVA